LQTSFVERRGPLFAATVAACAGLPGLFIPFLADDWSHLESVAQGTLSPTPFGYFRPLCMASYSFDRWLWGHAPPFFHLTNLALICAVAALVVVVIRRFTGRPSLAALAGLLFALHPYHVECAAWISARPDPLFSLCYLAAVLAYDRWRISLRGLPIAALALAECALLAKETAISLPLFLVMIGLCDRERPPTRREWTRGYSTMLAQTAVHLLIVRPWALGGLNISVQGASSLRWLKNLLAFGLAAILPAHTEYLEDRWAVWGGAAILVMAALLVSVRPRSGGTPRIALAALIAFPVLLGPSFISFQSRYLFLASGASSLALAALIDAGGRRFRNLALLLILPGWLLASAEQWVGWFEAGQVSTRLVGDLVRATRGPGVREIIVANMPHRVHGAPVNGDFRAAVSLSGAANLKILAATLIDLRSPAEDALDGAPAAAVRYPPPVGEVRLRVTERRYSRYVWPPRPEGGERLEREWGSIVYGQDGRLQIDIAPDRDRGRSACFWTKEGIQPLF
jgi:hypothetical protein